MKKIFFFAERSFTNKNTVYKPLKSSVSMFVEMITSAMFPKQMMQQSAGVWGLKVKWTGVKLNNFN